MCNFLLCIPCSRPSGSVSLCCSNKVSELHIMVGWRFLFLPLSLPPPSVSPSSLLSSTSSPPLLLRFLFFLPPSLKGETSSSEYSTLRLKPCTLWLRIGILVSLEILLTTWNLLSLGLGTELGGRAQTAPRSQVQSPKQERRKGEREGGLWLFFCGFLDHYCTQN